MSEDSKAPKVLLFKKRPKVKRSPPKKLKFKKATEKTRDTGDFMYYPDITDDNFYPHLWSKQEFVENISPAQEYYSDKNKKLDHLKKICSPSVIKLKSYQVFLRNYLSPETPYNSILVYHGIGTGKCLHPETMVYINGISMEIGEIWNKYNDSKTITKEIGITAEWSIPKEKLVVNSLNEASGDIVVREVNKLYRQIIDEPMRIVTLENGTILRLTLQHQLLTAKSGWTNNIKRGQMIALPKNLISTNLGNDKEIISPDLVFLSKRMKYQKYTDDENSFQVEYVKIEDVKIMYYSGYVYDLEVPENHNYVAEGVICHNTCSGVSIAEGLKEMTEKYNKKIYVIAGKSLQVNFRNTLYSMGREKNSKYPGSLQCTKTTYYIPPKPKESTEERRAREKAIRELQKRHYIYMGYTQFVNHVDKDVIAEGLDLGEYFSNTVFVVDEAHNLIARSQGGSKEEEEKRKTRQKLLDIFAAANNTKLILLSATPITNEINDIVVLVNLLRANDNRSTVQPSDLATDGGKMLTRENLDMPKFKQFVKGYISYVRGAHPSVFPQEIPINEYSRSPTADMFGDRLDKKMPDFKEIALTECEMSHFHFWNYWLHIMSLEKNAKDGVRSRDSQGDQSKISAGTAMYPLEDKDDPRLGGFDITDFMIKERGRGKMEKYKYRTEERFFDVSLSNEKYLHTNQNANAGETIGYPLARYSTKFYRMLKDCINNFGINFIFTRYKTSVGTIPISLILEQNGYVRYHRNLGKPNEFTGKYREKVSNMLDIRDPKYRCICGHLDTVHNQNYAGKVQDYSDPKRHRFLQGTYIRVDGDTSDDFDKYYQSVVTSPENKYGKLIKIIVGGKNMREGIDLRYVRSVHIMNPWHNLIQIEQTIGRAIRLCSHSALDDVDDMNVKVYKYTVVPPKVKMPKLYSLNAGLELMEATGTYQLEGVNFRDKQFWYKNVSSNDPSDWATIDEYVYARASNKDFNIKFAERIMKESAVDCYLNQGHNLTFPGDRDGSRNCDYTDCKYQCDYIMSPAEIRAKPNLDTYDLYFMEPKVQDTQEMIGDLFSKTWALTLKSIIELVQEQDPKINRDVIFLALDRMLGDPPRIKPSPVVDRFGRYGYLIYRHPFYVYQPDEVPDENLPTYYRQIPSQGKPREVDLRDVLDTKKPMIKLSKPIFKSSPGDRLGNITLSRKDPDESRQARFASNIEATLAPIADRFDPIVLASKLDTFTDKKHEYLIRTRIEEWVQSNGNSKRSPYDTRESKFKIRSKSRSRSRSRSRSPKDIKKKNPFTAEIIKYYMKNYLLAHPRMIYDGKLDNVHLIPSGSDGWVYNISGIFWSYNADSNTWNEINEDSELLYKIKERAISDKGPNFAKLSRELSDKIYGFLFNDNKEREILFKVTDVEGQRAKSKSYSEEVNIKTLARGQVCSNYSNPKLEELTKRLDIKYSSNLQRNQFCQEIEFYLRRRDDVDETTIHFLNFWDYKRKFGKLEETDLRSLYNFYMS